MKIVFTGGGTGGHFCPIIAVAQKVNKIIDDEKIIGSKLYYISDNPFDRQMLFENGLTYEEVITGKMRTYFSFKNFTDLFKIFFGMINALYKLFSIYPDVVFGKGGYASFPTIFAARVLGIPVMIHESDSVPGRVNQWAGHFARRVAISYKESVDYFPSKNTAWTGQPIRVEIESKAPRQEALEYFKLESNLPVVVVLGGSQGAELINNAILDALPKITQKFQIIHQTGIGNYKNVTSRAEIILGDSSEKVRYLPYSFLNPLALKMAAGVASIIITRAGSTLFEISSWGIPSIVIPITSSHGNHQRKNAFSYAHTGAASVIEEVNMTANILNSELERIMGDKEVLENMARNAKNFNKSDAAYKIARELIDIALSHEK